MLNILCADAVQSKFKSSVIIACLCMACCAIIGANFAMGTMIAVEAMA